MCDSKTCVRRLWKNDEKRLKQYPNAIRKIKRLRKQIRDLNRALNKLRPAVKFIVASNPDPKFPHWKQLFYIDTRNQIGWGDCDDIFSSSPYKNIATKYDTEEAAQKWNEEFLQGEGIIIPV